MELNLNKIINIENDKNFYIEILKISEKEKVNDLYKEANDNIYKLNQYILSQKINYIIYNNLKYKECFLEIHAGIGGMESDDWVCILHGMYRKWLNKHKLKYLIINNLSIDKIRCRFIILKILDKRAYHLLKKEKGVHKLVRLSPFNKQNKRHTTFAHIDVYPLINTNKIDIKEDEIRIDTYKSSGAGGQHVNTTNSAVRIIHFPTNIVVHCQSYRSQHKNKNECINILKTKIFKKKKIESKKNFINWGNHIRSYILHPYQMVHDINTNTKLSNVNSVLDGNIDIFIEKSLKIFINNK